MLPPELSVPKPLPPRDYPDSNLQNSAGLNTVDDRPVTVRCVLDRMASKQTVTHDMISTAVTNLFTADADVIAESQSRPVPASTPSPRVPKAITALINTVRRH